MRLLSVLLLLIAASGSAQEQPDPATRQLLPQRQKALESAVRNLLTDRTTRQPSARPDVRPRKAVCGYIRVVPITPNIEPGIVVPESRPDAKDPSRYGMPVYQGLPPCDLPAR